MNIQDEIEMEKIRQQLLFRDSHESKESEKTATAKQVAAGKKGRLSGLKFEEDIAIAYGGRILSNDRVKSIHNKKTNRKTDIVAGKQRFSTKNPGNISTSIQIQACPLTTFSKRFSIKEGSPLYDVFQQFLGAAPEFFHKDTFKNNPKFFGDFANDRWGINPMLLDENSELRRSRILFNNLTDGDILIRFFEENKRGIADMCFRSGMIHPSEEKSMATHVLWASKKDDVNSIEIIDIQNIIDSCDSWVVSVQPSQSVIKIGPITFQMKGSGSSSYHNMQFNASLRHILSYTKKERV